MGASEDDQRTLQSASAALGGQAKAPGIPRLLVIPPHDLSHAADAQDLELARSLVTDLTLTLCRSHFYEGQGADVMTSAIRTFKLMGCESVLLTCAAGSLRAEAAEGFRYLWRHPVLGPVTAATMPPRAWPSLQSWVTVASRFRMRI